MGETTIEWCDYTFNPVRGCTKVSAGCANCYAERQSRRNPAVLGEWGDDGKRVVCSEAYWENLDKWYCAAQREGKRKRVFVASLSDVFEDRPEWVTVRRRLFWYIKRTAAWLDFLLQTKRPENIGRLWPVKLIGHRWESTGPALQMRRVATEELCEWPGPVAWPNVWIGVSVENQEAANKRIPELLRVPAAVRFLSCEPLLGPVDLHAVKYMQGSALIIGDEGGWEYTGSRRNMIDWVIVGGESGPGARPMHPEWVRGVRDQCVDARVPFFFKQWGEWAPIRWQRHPTLPGDLFMVPNGGGIKISARGQMPASMDHGGMELMRRVGKREAWRWLDGRVWDEKPEGAR